MARKAKVTESTSTVETQDDREGGDMVEFQSNTATDLSPIELVDEPGPVKKIRFDGDPDAPAQRAPPQASGGLDAPDDGRPEGEFRRAVVESPKALREHSESIYSIHEEVDHLGRPDPKFRGAPPRSNLRSWKAETLYRTDRGGEVRAYEGPTGRTYTLADGHAERRFTEADVDRVISSIRTEESRTETTTRTTATVDTQQETEEEAAPARSKPSRSLFGFMGRRSRKGKETAEPEEAGEEADDSGEASEGREAKEYQPQCSAITDDGLQCRNSARGGSKYCSSHYGFQPRTVQGIHESRDTEPRYDSSRDTRPGGAGWDPTLERGHQCAAVTRGGKQCMNPVVTGSPYCGSHQDYTEPTKREIVDSVDTKPRWAKAKDTKPSTRKSAKPARPAKAAKAAKKTRRK